ncbi:MFS transporter [Sulfobacillus harzensis]|uniref:MFS transporter n=1 Tax=Sulfobacillus harzensis TaxID=2729629 RepID=A0A7Y0L7L6_9FIRM|nr:MFS transporter [Sulfobacillus harzensis]
MNSRSMRRLVGYRRLWLATAQIGLSSWMVQVALFAALVSHHSARVMAMVLLLATMPSLLAGPLFGAWLDRRAMPELAAWAAGVQAVLLPVMAWLVVHHLVLLTGVYAVYNLTGTLSATGRQQLRYHMVPPDRWAEVNARLGGVTGITTIVGALLGGTVALWGLTTVLLVSAAARLVASILLVSLARRVRILNAASDMSSPDPDDALRDGLRALKRFPAAMSVLLVGIAWGVLGGSYDVLLSDYGVRLLHGGGWGLSGLYATDGLGVLLGTWVARKIRARWRPHAYGLAYLLQGAFWTAFALSHTWALATPWLLAMRMASGLIIAWDTTLLLETVPDRLHSRVYGLHTATYGIVGRASLALTALVMSWAGPRAVAVGSGIGSILVGATWWWVRGRRWPPAGGSAAGEGLAESVSHNPQTATTQPDSPPPSSLAS